MKIIGKLYSGKPNVQFDEGELEIEQSATTPALYSTETIVKINLDWTLFVESKIGPDRLNFP
jgi:hypothetical protein